VRTLLNGSGKFARRGPHFVAQGNRPYVFPRAVQQRENAVQTFEREAANFGIRPALQRREAQQYRRNPGLHFRIERYGVPPAKVALIANGIAWTPWDPARLAEAVARFRQTSGIRGDGPVVGTVTRLAPAKGLPTLLQAFHQLRRQVPSARLLIVGDGPLKTELVRSAYALGEQEQIIFSGIAVETRVPLSMMDVFVLPSHHEAFGLAIVEAMAMGRPVVASRVGGIPTIVDDGVTGLLVPPNDPDALARALGQMLDDPERRRAMGSAGHARYEREFTMDRVAREVESVYEEVVQG